MRLADLVALSLAPGLRRRVYEAYVASGEMGGSLEAALDLLQPGGAGALAPELAAAARRALEAARRLGLLALPLDDPRYPPLLASIPDPPLVLWVRGDVGRLAAPAVAIVGSRAASHGSREVAARLGADLAARGLAVVSGLARGCDGAAHHGAASCGVTVAVLGSGPDVIYPPEHDALAARIVAAGGALVAELPPGTPPLSHHFPLRNRIISGLSLAVVVIEAGERSGSLITAACALEQGRDVMAVPGVVIGGRHRGSHALLRDGARLVETADDVLEELEGRWPGRLERAPEAPAATDSPGPGEDPVLDALRPGDELDLDDFVAATGLPADRVLARLGELELDGRCSRLPGGRYVRHSGKVIT